MDMYKNLVCPLHVLLRDKQVLQAVTVRLLWTRSSQPAAHKAQGDKWGSIDSSVSDLISHKPMLVRAYPAPDSNPKHPNSSRDSNFYHNIFSNRACQNVPTFKKKSWNC